MATPDPPPGSGTVTVASQGAAAFVGDVYYLADGRTGDPILGWPPRPPPVGFSRGDARDGDDAPDAFGRTKAQREGDRVLLATNAADATRAMRRFRETCFPSRPTSASVGETRVSDDEARAVASLDSAATRNRALGPSAYFPDPAFARRWAEVVNRPCGLSYRAFARRRLRRPSDKPLLPHGVAIRAAPFARAYANLTVGWNNAALAAKRGLAPSASARRDAADALFARSDLDPSAVMGANPEIAGDGTAESVAPLLTGYEGFLPFAPFEDENAFGRTGREGEERGSARDPLANDGGGFPRSINAWLADDLAAVESVDGSHYPETSGSWRAVAARVGGLDAARTDSKTNREKTNRESGKDAADARGAWYRGFDESFDDGSEHERERFDRVVSARAVDRENVSVGECPRRAGAERPPADTPVFSSPLVHVVAVGGAAGRRDAERGFENVSVTGQVTGDSSRVVISENEGARDKKSASEYPLGVKFATRDEATGNVAVTSAQMYRPWFLKLEDLREMVRAAIKTEAEARVARNRARREKTNRALAAMLTAVCHTKPNPRLSGFQMPGLDGANRGAGRGGSGGVTGGVSLGGGGDDDDDSEDDDDDPRNEGLEDDDDGSLNDDELMKEYMREMVKDGTAEDALGAWARDAARAAKEARENTHPKGRKNDEKADDLKSRLSRRWMPGFLKRRFDEKDTYQQLDISPAAHAGLVFAATLYYAWNVSRSFCGDALDRAFLKTNFGRWSLVIDTPLADAMEHVEIGSFEGVCCAAVAQAAASDVSRRYDAMAKARSATKARLRRDVASTTDASRRAVVAESAVAAAAERELDLLDALGDERNRREGNAGDEAGDDAETTLAIIRRSARSDPKDVSGASGADVSPPRRYPRGGPLRGVPVLRRIPVLGAKRQDARKQKREPGRSDTATGGPAADDERSSSDDDEKKTTKKVTVVVAPRRRGDAEETETRVPTRTDDERTSTVPTLDLDRGILDARRARDEALAAWASAREHTMTCLRAENDAREALVGALSEDLRDNEEAFRFAEATRDALARAERARSANAAVHERRIEEAKKKTSSKKKNAFDVASFARERDGEDGEASERDGAPPSSAEGGVAASISEKNDDRGTAENATATTAHVSLATVSAPPLFVANLSEGGTLGDGTQAADDDSGALLRGFIGTGKYSRARRRL